MSSPRRWLRRFEHPRVTNDGFVDDIDAELQAAKVFLLCNNSHPDYVVGHTRILHAWSLGSCLVAHLGMARAMPEIVHGENALLGSPARSSRSTSLPSAATTSCAAGSSREEGGPGNASSEPRT